MKIFDYQGRETYISLDLDDPKIIVAFMRIISGDEILSVVFKENGEVKYEHYDSYPSPRSLEFIDDDYVIVANGEWQVDRDKFLNRPGADWRWYTDLEDETDGESKETYN